MPNVTPPVDKEEALSHPTYWYQDRVSGIEILMGPEKFSDGNGFRYVIVHAGINREVWQGYLYKEET